MNGVVEAEPEEAEGGNVPQAGGAPVKPWRPMMRVTTISFRARVAMAR